eukprot:5113953-Pyramimonas_sp.AAC.1
MIQAVDCLALKEPVAVSFSGQESKATMRCMLQNIHDVERDVLVDLRCSTPDGPECVVKDVLGRWAHRFSDSIFGRDGRLDLAMSVPLPLALLLCHGGIDRYALPLVPK